MRHYDKIICGLHEWFRIKVLTFGEWPQVLHAVKFAAKCFMLIYHY